MKKLALLAALTVAALPALPRTEAHAGGGGVAAGIAGGLIGGAIIGSALAGPRTYYYEPAPAYGPPPYSCYWSRGAPVWDDYRGVWYRPRVRVCN